MRGTQRAGVSLVAEIVERHRLAAVAGRAAHTGGYAMKRMVAGSEDHATVEQRRDALHATLHRGIPQLEPATVRFVPVAIEIEKQIDLPAPRGLRRVRQEIAVDVEKSALQHALHTTPIELRVGDEPLDAG